jgi:DNA (cytosine-5)-methyltransferase 1
MKHKIFDLFCGPGGFSKGFENSERATFETILGVDILPMSVKTFSLNHPDALAIAEDIRKLSCEDLRERLNVKPGDIGVIAGGPPCQGFSSIRPFRASNVDDPRNTLFEQFANFVNFFRPRALVIENVVGLATHDGGKTLEQMQECFSGLGYDCDWRILNAANFGVPQRRERLIFIGVERGGRIPFPRPTHHSSGSTIGYRDKSRMLVPVEDLFTPRVELEPAISVMDAIGDLPPIKSGGTAEHYELEPQNRFQRARRKRLRRLSLHFSTAHTAKMLEIIRHSGNNITSIPSHLITSGFSSCYSRLEGDKPAVTITVNFVHPASNRCIHPKCDRALTPREGARLQSFDDDFQFAGNRAQIVKQIGNAVPPLLGKAIADALTEIL